MILNLPHPRLARRCRAILTIVSFHICISNQITVRLAEAFPSNCSQLSRKRICSFKCSLIFNKQAKPRDTAIRFTSVDMCRVSFAANID